MSTNAKSPRKTPQPLTFEQALQRLEEIVRTLEQGDISLDESVKAYEEGIALSKLCLEKLTQAELKLKTLGKDIEGNLALFEEEPT